MINAIRELKVDELDGVAGGAQFPTGWPDGPSFGGGGPTGKGGGPTRTFTNESNCVAIEGGHEMRCGLQD